MYIFEFLEKEFSLDPSGFIIKSIWTKFARYWNSNKWTFL